MKHDTLHTVLLCVYDTNKDEGVGGTNDEKHDRCRTGLQDQDRYSCTRAWGWHGVCSWPLCPIESSQSFLPKFPGLCMCARYRMLLYSICSTHKFPTTFPASPDRICFTQGAKLRSKWHSFSFDMFGV